MLFIDEVGDIMSQKNDGNVGGQKFLVQNDQRALIQFSYTDSHFTVLGFTTASGKPVCCVNILLSSEVEAKHVMGLQPWAEVMGELATNSAENLGGIDKYCPFGPNCTYLGIKIPTFVSCSENGSITSEILGSVM